MVGEIQSMMRFLNPHLMKIDVVKFDDTNNFGLWRCEVMDALTTSNLEDILRLKEKPKKTFKKNWDKMNRTKVLFDTRHQVSCAI